MKVVDVTGTANAVDETVVAGVHEVGKDFAFTFADANVVGAVVGVHCCD